MSRPEGRNFEDAIVLDDEEPEELAFVDLSDNQPRAKVTPIPTVAAKINVPCYDDILVYGEEFKKSVQSLTAPVAHRDNDQRTFRVSASPRRNRKDPSACKSGQNNYENDHDDQRPLQPGAQTTRIGSSYNGRVQPPCTNLGECSPKIATQDDQRAIECFPHSATATVIPKQEADRQLSVSSQLARRAPKNRPSSGGQPTLKKSGTLAQRMKLPKLPAVTNDHDRPMGFAAMLSAIDDSPYTPSHAVQKSVAVSPVRTKCTANEVPTAVSPVPPQAIVASSPTRKIPAKTRPKKAPTKNTETRQPKMNILKHNLKRPLSEMGIHDLFTPGQLISNTEWEAKKRQRLEGKRRRTPKEVQDGVGIGPVEVEVERGRNPDELPDVVACGDRNVAEPRKTSPVDVHGAANAGPSEVPETRIGPFEMDDTTDTIPSKVPGTAGPGPVELSDEINDQATTSPETLVSELTLPREVGVKSSQTRLPMTIEEPSTILEEPIPTTRPTTAGKGISEATLAAWRTSEGEDIAHATPYHTIDEQQEELITVTETTYDYHVHRREWLIQDPEGEANAEELILGPFYTLQEANEVVAREVRYPIQLVAPHGIPSSAWDYSFRRDPDGMQTQVAEVVGVHIEAEVQRELALPDERTGFPASAFKVTPRVYLVQELSWSPTPTPTSSPTLNATPSALIPPLCETITHACCTTLDRANKKAAEEWLAAYIGTWSDFHAEGKRKDEVERGLKFDMKEMREGRECFHREVVFASGAMCKIWVVECEVEGPRN